MELPILYEDTDVVAVAKPAGLITHSDGRTKEETAEDWFKEKYPEVAGVGAKVGYVHRLDRDTSGVLVFAKNPVAYEFLRKAFHDREVHKTYLAFVYGMLTKKAGTIDFDIGRSRKDFRLRSAQPKAKGHLRNALTKYEVLAESEGYSLLKMSPETGRTHQIRVHLKAIHHPIVGDTLYATGFLNSDGVGKRKKSTGTPDRELLGINRLGLHAYSLDLPLPTGGRTSITAPIPADLRVAFNKFPVASEQFALS
jgi:23S rRNA pseudouridine1911/1915/1917 synthase